MTTSAPPEDAFRELVPRVCDRLARNQRIRRTLPGDGRLRIDRQLPFLFVHRLPPDRPDPGTRDLVTSEAAYLFASGAAEHAAGLGALCDALAATLREHFGAMLFVEIWSAPPETAVGPLGRPGFRIVTDASQPLPTMVDECREALERIRIDGRCADVGLETMETVHPPGLAPLSRLSAAPAGNGERAAENGTGAKNGAVAAAESFHLGLEVRPIYRDDRTGTLYPVVLRNLRRQLATALRRTAFAFGGAQRVPLRGHFEALGPSAPVRAAGLADQQLCEISESFDFLLQVTPVNADEAWREFAANGCREAPVLHYRPLPYDPVLLKRRLFGIEIERLEDPTLAHLFAQKQTELDRQLSALRDIGTPEFAWSAVQLYGAPDRPLVETARHLLRWAAEHESDREQERESEPDAGVDEPQRRTLDAEQIADLAREEIDRYHSLAAGFFARVETCDHIASGLMVAGDRLFVLRSWRATARDVLPLLHHEVGTHLLTHFNGRQQPLRLLAAGLAGYEPLQEGLAVLAEYLVGGLTRRRLRTLAARVVAVDAMLRGEGFASAFGALREEHGLSPHAAYAIVLRAFRGGGLPKDALYLQGLLELLAHLRDGHELEPLFVGKIGLEHVPFVQELRRRGFVRPPSLLPRFWNDDGVRERLRACAGGDLFRLVEDAPRVPPPR